MNPTSFFLIPCQAGGMLNAKFVLASDYSNGQIIAAVSVILISMAVSKAVQYFIFRRLKKLAESTENEHDDRFVAALDGPVALFVFLWAVYIAVAILNPPQYKDIINKAIYMLVTINLTWLIYRLIDVGTFFVMSRYKTHDKEIVMSMFPMINKVLKIFLLLIAFILIVQNLGYSVSSLLAGLGIGGLAVALAAKDTLANVFGSVMIFLDRPFVIGDWVIVGGTEGIVEDVGFRTTRIRTWARNEVSIPNSVVVNETIQNYSRRPQQRIMTTIGVTYDTPPDKLEEAVRRIREIIKDHPDTDKNTIYIYFSEFGDSYLGIFLYFFIDSPVWSVFLNARHEIFIKIMKTFEELGVEFAFPTRTVHLETAGKLAELIHPEGVAGERITNEARVDNNFQRASPN